jgi:hypothetical protein
MAKITIIKKGNSNPTAPQPCPWVVDWAAPARK